MRRSKPVQVSDLLALFVKENGLEEGLAEYQFMKLWDEIMGVTVSKATVRKKLKDRKLYVTLSSSVVRHELFMMRTDIVKELNRRIGKEVIDELVLN